MAEEKQVTEQEKQYKPPTWKCGALQMDLSKVVEVEIDNIDDLVEDE